MSTPKNPVLHPYRGGLVAACLAASLSLCGCSDSSGNDSGSASTSGPPAAEIATGTVVLSAANPAVLPAEALQPTYHLSPVLPPEPSDVDAQGGSLSAYLPPQVSLIPESLQNIPTHGLTADRLAPSGSFASASGVTPKIAVTYSPAQIRAAYNLPALPTSLTGLSSAQAAQLGAGQTIYIVDANHDSAAFTELAAFNQKFGLPAATNKALATNASFPLAAPSANSCDFYQVYSTASGGMTSTAPSYDPNWAIEIALDVQSAHAVAPLARIVLIEAPDASFTSLTGAISLANKMGPGVVSMSFGGGEGSYVTSLDSYFQGSGMTYFAATGDNGAGVSWPAVSPYVVAVGGTSLTYSGSGPRSETVWSGTGGGVSAYEPKPSYQTISVPGLGTPAHRSVADVAFNADPNTGQYVAAVQNQTSGGTSIGWLTVGGTSLATPQWAGLAAVANAMRVQSGKSVLGDPHSALYAQVGSAAATYAADFYDVTQGNDGSATIDFAKAGYDNPTGLGTPNVLSLLNTLVGSPVTAAPPVVTGATINGTSGQALTFTASIADANPYNVSLSGAPSGMTIASNAVVTWPSPAVGSYNVTVIAKDAKTGLSGQGVYSIIIAAPAPPTVSSGNVTGSVGQALSFNVTVADANPYTLSLTGAPTGMTISSTGVVSWPSPVAGTYSIAVTAKDTKTGLSGKGTYGVTISTAKAPTVGSGTVTGKVGTALSFNASVTDVNPYTLSLSGAPNGMTISSTGTVTWPSPVAGNYAVTVMAKDSKTGLTGQGVYTLQIASASGPIITSSGLTGVAGKALSGTLIISDSTARVVGVGIGGVPLGMSFAPQGGILNNITVSWTSPVTGNYVLQVTATDASGLTSSANIPVTITSK